MARTGSVSSSDPPERIREWVFAGNFVGWKEFMASSSNASGRTNIPGCYVILIFKGRHVPRKLWKYHAGYIGQSVDAVSRVHDHLSGNGNRNVFSDLESGMAAAVQIIPCSGESLNDMECALISAFGRERLYNRTAGGAAHRCAEGTEFFFTDRRLLHPGNERLYRVVLKNQGRKPCIVSVDGIRICRLYPGRSASLDLPGNKHTFRAKRFGSLPGKKKAVAAWGTVVTAEPGGFRIRISVARSASPYYLADGTECDLQKIQGPCRRD